MLQDDPRVHCSLESTHRNRTPDPAPAAGRGLRRAGRRCWPTRRPRATSAAPQPRAAAWRRFLPMPGAWHAAGLRDVLGDREVQRALDRARRSVAAGRLARHRGRLGIVRDALGQGLRAPKPRPPRSTGPSINLGWTDVIHTHRSGERSLQGRRAPGWARAICGRAGCPRRTMPCADRHLGPDRASEWLARRTRGAVA